MKAICENCKYFEQDHFQSGFCKRFPPKFYVETNYRYEGEYSRKAIGVTTRTGSPIIKPTDWCGEHKKKVVQK